MNKGGFEFGFVWIFAIIIGAVIIFLAIFAVTSIISTERLTQDTETGKQIGILLNPIETNLEEAKTAKITFAKETRIYNGCESFGTFGKQKISVASKSDIGNSWEDLGIPSSFNNKYLFSENITEGKNVIVLSKHFEMPFKVANLVYMWSSEDSYCFVDPPSEIKKEIGDLNQKTLVINDSVGDCPSESKKVCFNSLCDISVYFLVSHLKGEVEKTDSSGNPVHYEGLPLLYGAIFSDPGIYGCQVERLLKRTAELSDIYLNKTSYLEKKGCSSNLGLVLEQLSVTAGDNKLVDAAAHAKELDVRNGLLKCKLF